MQELKLGFESLGYKEVITYLNSGNVIFERNDFIPIQASGNVIFSSNINDKVKISNDIYKMLENKFNLKIPVFVIKSDELNDLLSNKPDWWGTGDKNIYDNIIFIIPPTTYKDVYEALGEPKIELEKIKEYKNSIFWSYDLKNYRKTNWWSKTASTIIRNSITIRTANTMKKVLELCR